MGAIVDAWDEPVLAGDESQLVTAPPQFPDVAMLFLPILPRLITPNTNSSQSTRNLRIRH